MLGAMLFAAVSCSKSVIENGPTIVGSWTVRSMTVEVEGVSGTEADALKAAVLEEMAAWDGYHFVFGEDWKVNTPKGESVYWITGDQLAMVHPGQDNISVFSVDRLTGRQLELTYDALVQLKGSIAIPPTVTCLDLILFAGR